MTGRVSTSAEAAEDPDLPGPLDDPHGQRADQPRSIIATTTRPRISTMARMEFPEAVSSASMA